MLSDLLHLLGEGEGSKVGKLDGGEFDVEVVDSLWIDVSLLLERLIDLCDIVGNDGFLSQRQLPDPLSTLLPDLPFGVEESELGSEEGDEVRRSMDRDGSPEERKSEVSDSFGSQEKRGRAFDRSRGRRRSALSAVVGAV